MLNSGTIVIIATVLQYAKHEPLWYVFAAGAAVAGLIIIATKRSNAAIFTAACVMLAIALY